MRKLQSALGYQHRLTYLENTLMSNFDLEEVSSSKSKPKYITAKITVDRDQEPLFVTNLHLHYKAEPTRLRELGQIEKQKKNCGQIWVGDFNSLTREDYDEDYWEDIARVRRENFWEPPRTAVTSQMKKMRWVKSSLKVNLVLQSLLFAASTLQVICSGRGKKEEVCVGDLHFNKEKKRSNDHQGK